MYHVQIYQSTLLLCIFSLKQSQKHSLKCTTGGLEDHHGRSLHTRWCCCFPLVAVWSHSVYF